MRHDYEGAASKHDNALPKEKKGAMCRYTLKKKKLLHVGDDPPYSAGQHAILRCC
jgi:hypothetical protein